MTAFALPDRLTIVARAELQTAPSREEPRVQALIEAARTGDREAFGDLVAVYERVVYRTSLAALGHAEDAEDAAQDAFVMAWQKLPGFRGDSSFKTWLLTIVWPMGSGLELPVPPARTDKTDNSRPDPIGLPLPSPDQLAWQAAAVPRLEPPALLTLDNIQPERLEVRPLTMAPLDIPAIGAEDE